MENSIWIDISMPLYPGMVTWPDDTAFEITRVHNLKDGDQATVSKLCMSAHNGTHMDAPAHFLPDGQSIDSMPLEASIGLARIIEIHDPKSIKVQELEQYNIQSNERILFKTANSSKNGPKNGFLSDYVHVSKEAALYLAQCRINCLGIDYLSVGSFDRKGDETHRILLKAGVWIIEGLDLSGVEAGLYELVCLPLRITGSDGSPARAVIRPVY